MLTPLINLITTTPGNLVYHLVLTFAAAAGLQGIILHQDAHSRTRGRRLFLHGRLLHQQAAKPGERLREVAAMHDHVDHAVILQVLGALEAIRQLL
ncbi:MAG TPA: hypothetical protein PLV53_11490, partial [Anaerolineaceae bacterium]|nr:hypothetical protein [Anaerolineaceae bacterium]